MARTVPPCAAPAMTLASAEAAEPAATSGLFLREAWTLFHRTYASLCMPAPPWAWVTVVQPEPANRSPASSSKCARSFG